VEARTLAGTGPIAGQFEPAAGNGTDPPQVETGFPQPSIAQKRNQKKNRTRGVSGYGN